MEPCMCGAWDCPECYPLAESPQAFAWWESIDDALEYWATLNPMESYHGPDNL